MGKINFLILLFAAVLCCNSCKLYKVTYSTTGASISPDVKTFSVDYFPNKAPLVVPYLSSLFTEKLTDYMRSKTGLSQLTDNNGDIRFEGQITEYSQRPIDIQKDEIIRIRKTINTISLLRFPTMPITRPTLISIP